MEKENEGRSDVLILFVDEKFELAKTIKGAIPQLLKVTISTVMMIT